MADDLPWSDSFLDSLKGKKFSPLSFLGRLVFNRDRVRQMIDQLHAIWVTLPASMKQNKGLLASLRSSNESTLWGAYNEVVTAWLLQRYLHDVIHSPKIGDQTPDFSGTFEGNTHYFEVFSLSEGEIQEQENRDLAFFRAEVAHITSKFRISLCNPPRPNDQKNFHGLGRALQKYLADLKNPDRKTRHELSVNGATVTFRVYEWDKEGPIYAGGIGGIHAGDPQVNKLINNLERKAKKYKFQFVGICIVRSGWADLFTLTEAMLGKEMFTIPFVPPENPTEEKARFAGLDQTGFWGAKNPSLSSNNRTVGIIYCRLSYDDEGRVQLRIHTIKNQRRETPFSKIFHNLPDVFLSPCEGNRMSMPSAKLTPGVDLPLSLARDEKDD